MQILHSLRFTTWALLGFSLAGCYSHESYVLSRAQVESIRQPDSQSQNAAILAVRESDHKSVWVKTEALRPGLNHQEIGSNTTPNTATNAAANTVSIPVHAYNPKITAGAALTWIGTGISLFGTVLVAVGKIQDDNTLFLAGGISALAAEPLMWTGTALWILGALRPPFETVAPTQSPTPRPFY